MRRRALLSIILNNGVPNNEIWYTNGSTTEPTAPYKTDAFGVNIVSNTYNAEKECWVIKFDGDVTTIGEDAFSYRRDLISVTIPDSVKTIMGAFYQCAKLSDITIPNKVYNLGDWAFAYCSSLTSITIPNSVITIGRVAFYNSNTLSSVYCKSTTPPTALYDNYAKWEAFGQNASGRKIYVPTESVEAYKSAKGWSEYADDIVGYNF